MRKLKYLVLGLAFSACMVSLTGCGSDDDNNGSNQPGTSRETTTNRETSTNRETESNGNNNSATTGKLDEIGNDIETIFDDTGTMIKDIVEQFLNPLFTLQRVLRYNGNIFKKEAEYG